MPRWSGAACSLTQKQLSVRQEQWRRLVASSLVGAHRRPTGIELRFRPVGATAVTVESLVEAERECCAFLAWAVARTANELVVDIAGPAGTEAIFDDWERALQP